MGKSPDLYTLCSICDGLGTSLDNTLNAISLSGGRRVCVGCQGNKYTPLGLNKAQVDAFIRQAGERDALKARIIILENLLTRWQRFNEIEEVVEHGDFIALYNDTSEALETLPGDSPVESSGWFASDSNQEGE